MTADIFFYIRMFMRRLPLFAGIVVLMTSVAVVVALRLPTRFEADALLLLESPQIPDELAASTVRTAAREQLEIMEQRLLTRANLLDIANAHGVFAGRDPMFPDQIVDQMRKATQFTTRTGRDRATMFEIQFEADNAPVSAAVVSEYVTRILAENVAIRTDRAEETLEFFEEEVKSLGANLDRAGQRILEFKNTNLDALPDSLDFRLSRQASFQERVTQINREISTYNEQKDRLRQVFEATGRLGNVQTDNRTDEQRQLDALRDELTNALAIYSEQNPRVKLLKARVEALEKTVAAQLGAGTAQGDDAPPPLSVLDLQLAEIDSLIESLDQEKSEIEAEAATLAETIARTPTVSITLEALQRDYNNIQTQYNAAVERLSTAETGERIEVLSKGERITVIRQPVVPRSPASPNRRLISAGGLAIGVALGVGLIALLEILNQTIRRPVELTRSLGIAPLATLPYAQTGGQRVRGKLFRWIAILLILIAIPAGLYGINEYVMPLDLLVDRIRGQLGI